MFVQHRVFAELLALRGRRWFPVHRTIAMFSEALAAPFKESVVTEYFSLQLLTRHLSLAGVPPYSVALRGRRWFPVHRIIAMARGTLCALFRPSGFLFGYRSSVWESIFARAATQPSSYVVGYYVLLACSHLESVGCACDRCFLGAPTAFFHGR